MTTKPFIIIAAIAVTGAASLVALDRVQDWRKEALTKAGHDAALAELYKFAGAAPGDGERVSKWCQETKDRLDDDLKENDIAKALIRNCGRLGFL